MIFGKRVEKERCIASVREHLAKSEELSYLNIAALVDAFVYQETIGEDRGLYV